MKILEYSSDNLAKVLSNEHTSKDVISEKRHFQYLQNYLGNSEMNAKTIVVEENYISKDYLHDYASYYSLCFTPYSKSCKRVHFFDKEIDEKEISEVILKKESESIEFWKHYLGFIVVKPIPVTVIGYTVLKTYSKGKNFADRNFWGVRKYKVHLFGNQIELKSLAFQEQDSVLSACATTAIWSMLNKASVDFHTILKSPSQITKDADNTSPDGSRLFPNKGLNLLQICQAIENSGLVSEIKQPTHVELVKGATGEDKEYPFVNNQYLKKILNAYSPIGIPIILVVNVPNYPDYGLHAITVSGFKQTPPSLIPISTETAWLSDNIEKFYAHDDQWGPFVRIEFNGFNALNTPWTVFDYASPVRPTYVTNIVIPLYPKIRISYEDIEYIVLALDAIFTLFFETKVISDLVWDIKIQYSEQVKTAIKNSSLDADEKIKFLTKSFPKYVWVASCYIGENKVFDFIFDATDVSSAMIGMDLICYVPELKPILLEFLNSNSDLAKSLFNHSSKAKHFEFLIKSLS